MTANFKGRQSGYITLCPFDKKSCCFWGNTFPFLHAAVYLCWAASRLTSQDRDLKILLLLLHRSAYAMCCRRQRIRHLLPTVCSSRWSPASSASAASTSGASLKAIRYRHVPFPSPLLFHEYGTEQMYVCIYIYIYIYPVNHSWSWLLAMQNKPINACEHWASIPHKSMLAHSSAIRVPLEIRND